MHEPYQAPNKSAMTPFKHTYMGHFIGGFVDRSTMPKDHLSMGKPEFHQALHFRDGRDIDYKCNVFLFCLLPLLFSISLNIFCSQQTQLIIQIIFPIGIPYFCDFFVTPPMLLGWDYLGGPVWCPTMQLEVLFKRRPTGKEVLTSFVAPHIINGRFDCSGGVWDSDGNLFALTR